MSFCKETPLPFGMALLYFGIFKNNSESYGPLKNLTIISRYNWNVYKMKYDEKFSYDTGLYNDYACL